MAAPEAQIPHWDEVVATPEFQSADSTQREQFRQSYRFDLAKQAFLAGMPEKQVDANLKAFDDYSKPGVFQRIKNSLTGQPTAASAAAMGLDAASRTAAQSQSVMAGMDGTPVNTRASRYAPLSAQGLSGLERQVSANPQQAIEQSAGTGVIDRAKRGVAQDMVNQRTVTAHAGLNRTVENALGLPSKSIAATEEDPIARAKAAPGTVYDDYQDGPDAVVSAGDTAKIIARSVPEGIGSLFRGTYNIDRLADPLAGKLAALITGNPATDAQVRAYLELERQGKLQPWQDFGTKVMDWMMPVSKEGKEAVEQPLFLGNPLKGEAPKLNPRASLSQFIAKGGQVFGQMAPIIAAGVLTGPAGGALAGAAQAADEGGDEESSRIKKMSAEDLNKIPVYREYLKQGATPEEAKQATAADAGRWASVVQGMIGSLDGLLFKGAGEAAKKAVFKGFVKGGIEQGIQEPAESIGARVAASTAIGEKLDPARIGQGLYDDTALGIVTGSNIKAATEAGKPKQAAPAPEKPAPKTQAAPTPVTDLPTDAVPVEILRGKPEPAPAARPAPVVETAVDKAAHEAATSPLNDKAQPTDAQKEAGNYAKGSAKVGGLDISIENPQGSTRSGTDADGKAWSVPMQDHYGYVRGTEGKDKDHVDVFIKPGTPEDWKGPVYVVDQVDPKTGKLDEHKTIIGAASEQEARDIYQRNYAPGWNGLGDITRLPMAAFKSWVKDGAKREPLGDISQWKPQEQPDATNVPAEPGVQPIGRGDMPAGDRQNLGDGGQRLSAGDNAGAVPAKPDAPASARPAGAVSADVNATPLTDKAAVTSLANEIGWAERGGQMIRTPGSDGTVGTETISRTQWIPKSDFWPNRPKTGGALNEREAQAALTKFERGDFLTKREQRFIQYAKQFAAERDAQQPAASEPTKALAPEDINEAEFEHWRQTGEPGFGWMPIAEALDSATDAELAALDRLLEQGPITDERASMRALGFTDEEITATLGPDTTAGRGTADASQSQPAADAQADRSGTAAAQEVARPSLELTGQTEGQIRGEEARRAKQQADQRARDNAPSPDDDFTLTGSDRAADVGAARGQNSLFEPQSEYGQRDLFADEVPDNQRANLVERVSSARSDGIDAKTAVNRAEQRTLPGRYATGVKLEPGAVRDSAVAAVRNLQDAALATSSLSSLVREHIDVVVTDRAGKILAVQRMFGGATSQASAYPQEIIKFVTAIKGSSAFYVAHNHPSDNYTLSDADRRLSNAIGGLAKGIAPEYRGIVSVTTRGYAGYSADGVDESGPFREAAKKHRIRYLEETVEKRGYLGPVINAPEIAKTVVPEIAQGQQGIVFLDAQYHPTGFFPVNFEDATKLLDGELARDIVAAAYRSRASAAMMATQDYAPGPYVSFATSARDGVRNVGALLARIEVRALDAINSRGASRALVGDTLVGDTLFQRARPTRATLSTAEDGTPQIDGDGVSLAFAQPTERLEFFPTDDAQKLYNFAIMGPGNKYLGYVEALFDNGRPTTLYDIQIEKQNRGTGAATAAVKALLDSAVDGKLDISNIVPSAQGFWERLGIGRQNLEDGATYGDTITRESFGASPAGKNAGTDSGGARIAESQDRRAITAKRNPALSTPPETTALLRRLSVLESIRTCLG